MPLAAQQICLQNRTLAGWISALQLGSGHLSSKSCCCLRVQVYLELRGDGGSSGRVMFRDVQPSSFERGAVDSLTLRCRALGEVRQLVVGHDCSGDRRRWHLDTAEVRLAPAETLIRCAPCTTALPHRSLLTANAAPAT